MRPGGAPQRFARLAPWHTRHRRYGKVRNSRRRRRVSFRASCALGGARENDREYNVVQTAGGNGLLRVLHNATLALLPSRPGSPRGRHCEIMHSNFVTRAWNHWRKFATAYGLASLPHACSQSSPWPVPGMAHCNASVLVAAIRSSEPARACVRYVANWHHFLRLVCFTPRSFLFLGMNPGFRSPRQHPPMARPGPPDRPSSLRHIDSDVVWRNAAPCRIAMVSFPCVCSPRSRKVEPAFMSAAHGVASPATFSLIGLHSQQCTGRYNRRCACSIAPHSGRWSFRQGQSTTPGQKLKNRIWNWLSEFAKPPRGAAHIARPAPGAGVRAGSGLRGSGSRGAIRPRSAWSVCG